MRVRIREKIVQTWPIARAGMVIGLLGGSFDPAHAGHAHITREALKRLRLDRVWWLVTPANPIKARVPAPMTQRIAQAQAVINHPKVVVTDIESYLRGSASPPYHSADHAIFAETLSKSDLCLVDGGG